MTSHVPPLETIFRHLTDTRQSRGLRHPLPAVLSLVALATLCGIRGMQGISEWGRALPPEFIEALGLGHRPPSATTLASILAAQDREDIERMFSLWSEALYAPLRATTPETEITSLPEGVSIDGKTLRGSQKQGADDAHLLAAMDHRFGVPCANAPLPTRRTRSAR